MSTNLPPMLAGLRVLDLSHQYSGANAASMLGDLGAEVVCVEHPEGSPIRTMLPKQFLPLITERTMLQETALRAAEVSARSAPYVICSEEHRFLAAEQMLEAGIAPAGIVLEPVARNTAPALAAAALAIAEKDARAVMLVLPADHLIADLEKFGQAITTSAAIMPASLVSISVPSASLSTGRTAWKPEVLVTHRTRAWPVRSISPSLREKVIAKGPSSTSPDQTLWGSPFAVSSFLPAPY